MKKAIYHKNGDLALFGRLVELAHADGLIEISDINHRYQQDRMLLKLSLYEQIENYYYVRVYETHGPSHFTTLIFSCGNGYEKNMPIAKCTHHNHHF